MNGSKKLASVCSWHGFQAQSNVCGKASSLPYCGAPERYITQVGSVFTYKETPGRNKHSRLLAAIVSYK